ncbi:MAG: hypothetical protein ACFNT6_03955 [Neisseria sp.]|jgi:hypothetical protein|uniref:hypothetical protein n=1 Tax=Neisseria sp. TaxID=192066 RepID=UPI00361ECED4
MQTKTAGHRFLKPAVFVCAAIVQNKNDLPSQALIALQAANYPLNPSFPNSAGRLKYRVPRPESPPFAKSIINFVTIILILRYNFRRPPSLRPSEIIRFAN